MKISMMWKDALSSMLKGPITQKYPFVRLEAPEHLRSRLHWNAEKCTGCGLCAKDCPAEAIDVIVLDKKAKRFVFRYNVDCCTFCAQCVESCRQGSLEMSSSEWELAALTREAMLVYYGDDADIETVLAGPAPADAAKPAEG